MPIIKSAKKRVKVAHKATIRNSKTKRQFKNSLKNLTKKPSLENLKAAQSAIDKASKKHVIHKNKAARLKRQAARLSKAANIKPSKVAKPKAKTVKTATSKKPKSTPKKK